MPRGGGRRHFDLCCCAVSSNSRYRGGGKQNDRRYTNTALCLCWPSSRDASRGRHHPAARHVLPNVLGVRSAP